jgi:hypothetical protein
MSKPLHKFSDDPVTLVTDDTEARAIMLELGVLDQISRKTAATDTTSVCVVDSHPTHWCMCARIWDNPDPAENGFMVVAYPKTQVDRGTVMARMAAFLAGSTGFTVKPILPASGDN